MQKKFNPESKAVLKVMNELLDLKRGFQAGTQRSKELDNRLKDYSLHEVLEVLNFIWDKWKNWDKRLDYFNPTTLFRKRNFEKYHEDYMVTKERKSARNRTEQSGGRVSTPNTLSTGAKRFMAKYQTNKH
tara:strand:+ start:164 stop:553 length:390 start_codon:yes stop_codon:yes gene_type:complete